MSRLSLSGQPALCYPAAVTYSLIRYSSSLKAVDLVDLVGLVGLLGLVGLVGLVWEGEHSRLSHLVILAIDLSGSDCAGCPVPSYHILPGRDDLTAAQVHRACLV